MIMRIANHVGIKYKGEVYRCFKNIHLKYDLDGKLWAKFLDEDLEYREFKFEEIRFVELRK